MRACVKRSSTFQLLTQSAISFSENIYFTNAFVDYTYVEVTRVDGSYRTILLKTTDDQPRVIAVNPIKRFVIRKHQSRLEVYSISFFVSVLKADLLRNTFVDFFQFSKMVQTDYQFENTSPRNLVQAEKKL